jgi:hypothetical protein
MVSIFLAVTMLFALASQSQGMLNNMVKDSPVKHSKKNHLTNKKNQYSARNTDNMK